MGGAAGAAAAGVRRVADPARGRDGVGAAGSGGRTGSGGRPAGPAAHAAGRFDRGRAVAVAGVAIRRAAMLRGSLPVVAGAALAGGGGGLTQFRLEVGRPVQPMLAQTAGTVPEAFERLGRNAAVEWKLDGVRVQIHRDRDQVVVFTRTLEDITDRVPEVVTAARALPVDAIVCDGEVLALRPDGRPRRFQETASRVARRAGDRGSHRNASVPLTTYVFDVLHLDGTQLLDLPAVDRNA